MKAKSKSVKKNTMSVVLSTDLWKLFTHMILSSDCVSLLMFSVIIDIKDFTVHTAGNNCCPNQPIPNSMQPDTSACIGLCSYCIIVYIYAWLRLVTSTHLKL